MTDPGDRPDGPPVVAFWGTDQPDTEFRLGTREYDWHRHARGQLFCVESGLVHVRTQGGSWLLPPHRAGWIPAGMEHRVRVSGALSGWGVMLTPEAGRALPDSACVMGVSELLRALVRRATAWTAADVLAPEQARLVAVLLDEVRLARHEPLHLPLPTDKRLDRIVTQLIEAPDDDRTLAALAQWAGLSARTARRLFALETGMSLVRWRQQARLMLALDRLARGEAVAEVSHALGYATPSNFIAVFRKAFGASPGRYFRGEKRLPVPL